MIFVDVHHRNYVRNVFMVYVNTTIIHLAPCSACEINISIHALWFIINEIFNAVWDAKDNNKELSKHTVIELVLVLALGGDS